METQLIQKYVHESIINGTYQISPIVFIKLVPGQKSDISACQCSSSCGSNYSRGGGCQCSSNCGSNYSRG